MVLVRRCALLVAVVAAGCFSDKGLGGLTGLPATGTTSTTDTTAGGAAASDGSSGSTTMDIATSSTGTTSVPSTASGPATTDAPGCSGAGEACGAGCCGCLSCNLENNTCAPSDALCGTCQQCDAAGACALAPASTSCTTTSSKCEDTVFGVVLDTCHRYAVGLGQCDAAGQCVVATCEGMGEAILSCKSASCLLESGCTPDAPVDSVTFDALCATNAVTPDCQGICEDNVIASYVVPKECNAQGDCVEGNKQDCMGFKCEPDSPMCASSCADLGCTLGLMCDGDQCVP